MLFYAESCGQVKARNIYFIYSQRGNSVSKKLKRHRKLMEILVHNQLYFEKNVRYPVWTCRDPISLILGTR